MHLRSLLCSMVLLGCASSPTRPPEAPANLDPEPPSEGLRLPPDVHPLAYDVALTVTPGEPRFSGTVAMRLHLDQPRRALYVNADSLNVTAVTVGGQPAVWSDVGRGVGRVMLAAPARVPAGDTTVTFTYDAAVGHGGDSVYDVEADGEHYLLTTFEPVSARKALPCIDQPDAKVPFTLTLDVPPSMVALANAPVVDTSMNGPRKRVRFAQSAPLPTYLFAFAVGPFDLVDATLAPNELRANVLPIRGVAAHGKGPQIAYQLAQAGKLVETLERWFGVAYPYAKLDLIAVPGFPGAMENAAAISFDEYLMMVDPKTTPRERERYAVTTLAHELSHQWFGNLVTMQWWDDLWLNEAFATWLAEKIVRIARPDLGTTSRAFEEWRHAMAADMKASARRIREPIAKVDDIYSAFDLITYSKGASVIDMFAHAVGDEPFREGVRAYLVAHADKNATTDALLDAVSRAAGRDVAPAFKSFLDAAGTPLVTIGVGAPKDGALPLTLDVTRYRPSGSTAPADAHWLVPVCLAGPGLPERPCIDVEGHRETTLPFTDAALPWLVPNAEGAGYYHAVVAPESLLRAALAHARTPGEAVTMAASYTAAFDSGALSGEAVLDAITPLVDAEEPELVRSVLGLLTWIDHTIITDRERAVFRARVARVVGPRAKKLGWIANDGEPAEVATLRADVLTFMAAVVHDARTRQDATKRGMRLLAGDAIPAELRPLVLRVAAEDDATIYRHIDERLGRETDPNTRRIFIEALAHAGHPDTIALALDPRLNGTEMFTLMAVAFSDLRTQRAALAWFEANFDAAVQRVPPFTRSYMPVLFEGFCSPELRAAAEGFWAPRVSAFEGAPRALTEALEVIDQCIAISTTQRDSVKHWLARRR